MKNSRPLEAELQKTEKMKRVIYGDAFCFCYAQPRSHFGDVMLSGVLSKECAFGELAMLTLIKTGFVEKSATWTWFPNNLAS